MPKNVRDSVGRTAFSGANGIPKLWHNKLISL